MSGLQAPFPLSISQYHRIQDFLIIDDIIKSLLYNRKKSAEWKGFRMKEVKVAFLGFGNVGTGAYKILEQNGETISRQQGIKIKVEKILVRDLKKKRHVSVDPALLTNRVEDIVDNPEIDIVAEYMGGVSPARQFILAAMERGKTVVTANKEVVAKHWAELEAAARKNGVGLYFEASVGGGIPIIKALVESLQANEIHEIMGIINGTTNYILTKMTEEGRDFHTVLKEAQALGLAEPDPTSDIEGLDAVYKLSILSSIAFHARVPVETIYHEGITRITPEDIAYGKELGYVIRLLAIGKKQGNAIDVRVHPTFVPVDHPLAAVRDSYNAIFIKGNAVGNMMFYGRGAGDLPTGSAVVSDIISACQQQKHRYMTFNNMEGKAPEEVTFNDNWETEYFIRLTVQDKPGVLASIAGAFGKHQVSIASVIQKGHGMDGVPLIFVTHKARERSMKAAMEDIQTIDEVIQVENIIRVEG